jgi:transposase
MLAALLGEEQDAEALAELARGRLRAKLPELRLALDGRVEPHHRFLISRILAHIAFLEDSIQHIQQEIEQHLAPFEELLTLAREMPGIQATAASAILAEIGPDMSRFASDKHLASWAGVVRCITRLNIPGAARKNSKGGSWVNGLPHIERLWGTVACH